MCAHCVSALEYIYIYTDIDYIHTALQLYILCIFIECRESITEQPMCSVYIAWELHYKQNQNQPSERKKTVNNSNPKCRYLDTTATLELINLEQKTISWNQFISINLMLVVFSRFCAVLYSSGLYAYRGDRLDPIGGYLLNIFKVANALDGTFEKCPQHI